MAEKVITCPVCFDDDHCFEEVQEKWSSFMCFRCGYTSNSMYKTDSKELKTANEGATELMREIHFYDVDRDITWFPSIVNMGELGIVYPDGISTNWNYKYAQPRLLTEEEKKDEKYKGHDKILDVDNAQEFGQYEFLDALKKMGVVKDI